MLKPISEINLRENMGSLVLHLAQYCELQNINAKFFPIFSVENAERMENCP